MKVAVSIPDGVFEEIERLVKRLGASRSEIYSRALAEFVGRHDPERITETLNQIVRDLGAERSDEFTRAAARRALKRCEW